MWTFPVQMYGRRGLMAATTGAGWGMQASTWILLDRISSSSWQHSRFLSSSVVCQLQLFLFLSLMLLFSLNLRKIGWASSLITNLSHKPSLKTHYNEFTCTVSTSKLPQWCDESPMALDLHTTTVVTQRFTHLTQMLRMNFRLIRHIESIWFLQRTL